MGELTVFYINNLKIFELIDFIKMQGKELNLNRKLPVYVAIGFGIGGAARSFVISAAASFIALVFGSAFMGAVGGAALGMASENKKKVVYLSCAVSIGFAAEYIYAVSFFIV